MAELSSTLPKILGVCFYYPPTSNTIASVLPAFEEIEQLFPNAVQARVKELAQPLSSFDPEQLSYDFSILFEGQGKMPAPPWGSVYLEEENLLMGESTLAYRAFLSENDMVTSTEYAEPDDQFGLMLMAFSLLLEQNKHEAALELLEHHLLPWAHRYLELVQNFAGENAFYPRLAELTDLYLSTLKQELELTIQPVPLFY